MIMSVVFPHATVLTFELCVIPSEEAMHSLVHAICALPNIITVACVAGKGSQIQQGYWEWLLVHLLAAGKRLCAVNFEPHESYGIKATLVPLFEEMRRSKTLLSLVLTSVRFEGKKIKALLDLIENGPIVSLRLDWCDLQEADVIMMAHAIRRAPRFKFLHLGEDEVIPIREIVQLKCMEIVGEWHPSLREFGFSGFNIIDGPLQKKWRILDFWMPLLSPVCIPRIGIRSPLSVLPVDIIRLLGRFIRIA